MIGPNSILKTFAKAHLICERLKTAHSRLIFYADVKRREPKFVMDDWVFLKVSPMNGVIMFGKKKHISTQYIGPYEIIRCVGDVI